MLSLDTRKLVRIEDLGLANETDTAEWQCRSVRTLQLVPVAEIEEHVLAHDRISAVGTDNDVSIVLCPVQELDHHAFVVLVVRKDLLPKMDTIRGELAPEQLKQF